MVLKALKTAGGEGLRGRDTLRREVGKGGIVGLAVVHQNLTLAADAKMLVGAEGGIGHGDEGDVVGGKCIGGFDICPHVDVAAGHLGAAEEDMSAVASWARDFERVLAGMGGGAVEGDAASLVAVWCVDGPLGLIPSTFEAVGDLGKREGEEAEDEKSCLAEHFCGWVAVGSESLTQST